MWVRLQCDGDPRQLSRSHLSAGVLGALFVAKCGFPGLPVLVDGKVSIRAWADGELPSGDELMRIADLGALHLLKERTRTGAVARFSV